jgi:hypothetical protein
MTAIFPRKTGKSTLFKRLFKKRESSILGHFGEPGVRIVFVLSCVVLSAFLLVRGRAESQRPPLDTSTPDPKGVPRMLIGRTRRVMEQPVRDNSLNELLKRH